MRIASGDTTKYLYFVALDATDLKTRETGLSSFTVRRSRNGGASAAYTTPTINETDSSNMPGVYELLVDEDTTLDSGDDEQEVVLHITATGMAPVTRVFTLFRPKITAGQTVTAASGRANADVKAWNGSAAVSGTVQTNGANTAASFETDLTETEDDHWTGAYCVLTSGALLGQVRKITGYNGSTKVLAVQAFTDVPADAVTFDVIHR